MTDVDGNWLRTDETQEFLDDLEHFASLVTRVSIQPRMWKWAILALHQTMEGIFTCHLRGFDTSGIVVLTEKSASAVWERLNDREGVLDDEPWPVERLASLLELYKTSKSAKVLPEEVRLLASDEMNRSLKLLNNLRNEFDHFVPRAWSLEVSGMPEVVLQCCNIIEELAIKNPTLHSRLPRYEDEIRAHIEKVRSSISVSL